jgi:hypothetical protein
MILEPAASEEPARPRHPHRPVVGAQGRRRPGEQVRRPLDHQEQLPHRTSGAARGEGGECGVGKQTTGSACVTGALPNLQTAGARSCSFALLVSARRRPKISLLGVKLAARWVCSRTR